MKKFFINAALVIGVVTLFLFILIKAGAIIVEWPQSKAEINKLAKSRYESAVSYMEEGDYEDAIWLFKMIINEQPSSDYYERAKTSLETAELLNSHQRVVN